MILVLKSNTLKDIQSSFIAAVGGYYDQREANNIFYLILAHHFNLGKVDFLTNPNKKLTESEILIFEKAAIRLNDHEPIQYILGETEFDGCRIFVNEHVLIPRPETEELVNWIKDDIHTIPRTIIDLGTGSGCIAIALAKWSTSSKVFGIDISEGAIDIALQSSRENGLEINWWQDDLFNLQLEYGDYDLIVSNPPYIEESRKVKLAAHVANREPDLALFVPSKDPLLYYRAIAVFALKHLRNRGFIFLEINEEYGQITRQLMMDEGFNVLLKQDVSGKDRFLKCWL